jgi:hypothetical protein
MGTLSQGQPLRIDLTQLLCIGKVLSGLGHTSLSTTNERGRQDDRKEERNHGHTRDCEIPVARPERRPFPWRSALLCRPGSLKLNAGAVYSFTLKLSCAFGTVGQYSYPSGAPRSMRISMTCLAATLRAYTLCMALCKTLAQWHSSHCTQWRNHCTQWHSSHTPWGTSMGQIPTIRRAVGQFACPGASFKPP